jgi:DNA (cytosine-5)-methyltransferase 1
MPQSRLLDLFCGAGGAAMGYAQAGFDITGVDIRPQPHYPFVCHHADALTFPLDGFDVIHASPPCQAFSPRGRRRHEHPDLIAAIRDRVVATARPFVIENVPTAPLHRPIELCGAAFDLGVFRHRRFESNVPLTAPMHRYHDGTIGDGRFFTVSGHTGGTRCKKSGGPRHSCGRKIDGGTVDEWRQAMGISWMTARELAEAIPPAYTAYIGRQLLEVLV